MRPFRLHGMMQSYFTRKMTAYFEYKGIPYVLRRFYGVSPEADAAGFPGGVPAVETPEGEFMWDTTAMIHHLERRFPDRAVLPPDPVQRFLDYVSSRLVTEDGKRVMKIRAKNVATAEEHEHRIEVAFSLVQFQAYGAYMVLLFSKFGMKLIFPYILTWTICQTMEYSFLKRS